jgi:hypothetical protein
MRAARRIFFMGQPGSNKTENAMAIADYFQWRFISVADCLQREEAKKSDDGKRITECFKNNKMGKCLITPNLNSFRNCQ